MSEFPPVNFPDDHSAMRKYGAIRRWDGKLFRWEGGEWSKFEEGAYRSCEKRVHTEWVPKRSTYVHTYCNSRASSELENGSPRCKRHVGEA